MRRYILPAPAAPTRLTATIELNATRDCHGTFLVTSDPSVAGTARSDGAPTRVPRPLPLYWANLFADRARGTMMTGARVDAHPPKPLPEQIAPATIHSRNVSLPEPIHSRN